MLTLNCDLGESFGLWQKGCDACVMPLIDEANIACGMHASDPLTMLQTVRLAVEHEVSIGAHPGYPDKEGFGRRAMQLTAEEVRALVLYQIGALDGVARSAGGRVDYVKPHGALYHAMMQDEVTRLAIIEAVAAFPAELTLVMQATSESEQLRQQAAESGLNVRFEAFADRAYADDGQLLSRTLPGAVHESLELVVAQARQIALNGQVTTHSGRLIALPADTLCVHGDSDAALDAVKAIRTMLTESAGGRH